MGDEKALLYLLCVAVSDLLILVCSLTLGCLLSDALGRARLGVSLHLIGSVVALPALKLKPQAQSQANLCVLSWLSHLEAITVDMTNITPMTEVMLHLQSEVAALRAELGVSERLRIAMYSSITHTGE